MTNPKLFIGPMSKNIVDAIIDYSNENNYTLGIIPSRRQIEYNGGYVNNWTTKEFSEYVKSRAKNILLVRDHSGPEQGYSADDGMESFIEDCQFFDVIHIDVWKKYKNYEDGLDATVKFIKKGYSINKELVYEVGTEEAIRPFTTEELDRLLTDLKKELPKDVFSRIKYAVIQSGTALQGNINIGSYDSDKLISMTKISKKHGMISKEHNGDYLTGQILEDKFKKGLESINIAPEFGQIETKIILDEIKNNCPHLLKELYEICYDSKRWVKWVPKGFDPDRNKIEIINICGHYVFSNAKFLKIKEQLSADIDSKIKNAIYEKIRSMIECVSQDNSDLLKKYFTIFSNKDIESLAEMFSEDVKLEDWDIAEFGIKEVIKANKNIFDSVNTIKVKLNQIYSNSIGDCFACDITIIVNGKETIDVVDLIGFDENGKINKIKAYKK